VSVVVLNLRPPTSNFGLASAFKEKATLVIPFPTEVGVPSEGLNTFRTSAICVLVSVSPFVVVPVNVPFTIFFISLA